MRVLMTGCTSIQVTPDRKSSVISKIDVPASIVEALEVAGHTVDWRKVTPGEDLSGYDVAWVNLAPINSLNGRAGAMGALYTLGSGLPCVGFFDDWQFNAVFNGMRAVARRPEMLFKYLLTGQRGDEPATHFSKESAEAARARILEAHPERKGKIYVERYYMRDNDETVTPWASGLAEQAAMFQTERWKRGMVPAVPMYAWGNRQLVRKRMPAAVGPIEALDPSSTIYPLIAPHDPLPPDEKKRAWMLGALMPHDAWVAKKTWTWDLEYTGSKKMVSKFGGERVKTESDVLDRYNQVWGILSPPYPHAGSGWWRSRFMYSAKIGSVLVCDKGEGAPLGDAYRYTHAQVEQMSTDQLASVAAAQAAALRPYMPTPESFVAHCDRIVQRAFKEDKGWNR